MSSCCQWCCRPSLEKSCSSPNSDSVAVYTEGCVQWSYPADGDRGEGGGDQVKLRGGDGGGSAKPNNGNVHVCVGKE